MATMLMDRVSMDFVQTHAPSHVEHRLKRPVSSLSFTRTKPTEDVLMLTLSIGRLGVQPRFTQMEKLSGISGKTVSQIVQKMFRKMLEMLEDHLRRQSVQQQVLGLLIHAKTVRGWSSVLQTNHASIMMDNVADHTAQEEAVVGVQDIEILLVTD